jgi:hypothetical protein
MTVRRLAAGLGCAALLAGCALTDALIDAGEREQAPWAQAGGRRPASDVDSLVMYHEHIRKLPAAELAREHEAARQTYNRDRSAFNRVRLAMMLSLPNTPFNDDGRAIDLLDPVVRDANGKLHALALMLTSHLQEQRRLSASLHGLQQKLDALRSLERSLIERNR